MVYERLREVIMMIEIGEIYQQMDILNQSPEKQPKRHNFQTTIRALLIMQTPLKHVDCTCPPVPAVTAVTAVRPRRARNPRRPGRARRPVGAALPRHARHALRARHPVRPLQPPGPTRPLRPGCAVVARGTSLPRGALPPRRAGGSGLARAAGRRSRGGGHQRLW